VAVWLFDSPANIVEFQFYVDFANAFRGVSINDSDDDDDDGGGGGGGLFDVLGPNAEQQPVDAHLQSIAIISEINDKNYSPRPRYYPLKVISHRSARQPPSVSQCARPLPSNRDEPNRRCPNDFVNFNLVGECQRMPPHFTVISPCDLPLFDFDWPCYFLVKYLGRSACQQMWGAAAVRTPTDNIVHKARQLPSINDLPTLEASIDRYNLRLARRHASSSARLLSPSRSERGLIPLRHISYVTHDVKYSKVASCIVLRSTRGPRLEPTSPTFNDESLVECYAFLFRSREQASRFTLAIGKAFHLERPSRMPSTDRKHERSDQHRSRQCTAYRRDRQHCCDSLV
jgi:hypothetical protein